MTFMENQKEQDILILEELTEKAHWSSNMKSFSIKI